jgi:uncharacterized membrane protein HdeD (DUF308 family)
MSARLARNWWAIALRGVAAGLFLLGILALPSPTLASLVWLFAAYVAADGIFAILAGLVAARRGERWGALVIEGTINVTVAVAVLVWPAIAVIPFVRLASAWAVITGALLLAAARRLSGSHGRWLLAFAGIVSAGWGALVAAAGPSSASTIDTTRLWLVGYAVPFGLVLLLLAARLQRRQQDGAASSVAGVSKR